MTKETTNEGTNGQLWEDNATSRSGTTSFWYNKHQLTFSDVFFTTVWNWRSRRSFTLEFETIQTECCIWNTLRQKIVTLNWLLAICWTLSNMASQKKVLCHFLLCDGINGLYGCKLMELSINPLYRHCWVHEYFWMHCLMDAANSEQTEYFIVYNQIFQWRLDPSKQLLGIAECHAKSSNNSIGTDRPVASLMYSIWDLEKFESTRFYDWSWFYRYFEEN